MRARTLAKLGQDQALKRRAYEINLIMEDMSKDLSFFIQLFREYRGIKRRQTYRRDDCH